MQETLLSKLETNFKEFREYGTFYFKFAKEYKEKQKERDEFVLANIEDEKLISEYIYEATVTPTYYAKDLERHKERLITVYETIQDVVEIPVEIKTEMAEIIKKKNPIIFKIVAGEPIPVDEQVLEDLKRRTRESLDKINKR